MHTDKTRLGELLVSAERTLNAVSSEARAEAEIILARASGIERPELLARLHEAVDGARAEFERMLARRLAGEPVQYVTGEVGFRRLILRTDPRAMIPRRETETLLEAAHALAPAGAFRALDLCTGSGAVALALADEYPDASVVATDASEEALALARENARALEFARKIEFRRGDLFDAAAGETFDLVLSNPPYVSEDEYARLDRGVREHEPRSAFLAGSDGLSFLRRVAHGVGEHLRPGGSVAVEVGLGQSQAVRELFLRSGLGDARVFRDLGGTERVMVARRIR